MPSSGQWHGGRGEKSSCRLQGLRLKEEVMVLFREDAAGEGQVEGAFQKASWLSVGVRGIESESIYHRES